MVDRVIVPVVRYTDIEPAQKKANQNNRAATVLGATTVAGGATAATMINNKYGKQIDTAVKSVQAQLKKVKLPKVELPKIELPKVNIPEGRLKTVAGKATALVTENAGKVRKFASNIENTMPKKVKVAAGVAAGLLAVRHIFNAGRIEGNFDGFKQVNETSDNVLEAAAKTLVENVDNTIDNFSEMFADNLREIFNRK